VVSVLAVHRVNMGRQRALCTPQLLVPWHASTRNNMGEQESLGSRSLRGGQCNTKSPQALAGGVFFFFLNGTTRKSLQKFFAR
jgi:hypothetical protein